MMINKPKNIVKIINKQDAGKALFGTDSYIIKYHVTGV